MVPKFCLEIIIMEKKTLNFLPVLEFLFGNWQRQGHHTLKLKHYWINDIRDEKIVQMYIFIMIKADNDDHIVIIIIIIHRHQINKNGDTHNYIYLYVQELITGSSSLNLTHLYLCIFLSNSSWNAACQRKDIIAQLCFHFPIGLEILRIISLETLESQAKSEGKSKANRKSEKKWKQFDVTC